MWFLSILWLTSLRLASCRCKPRGLGAGTPAQRQRSRRPGAADLQSSCRYSSNVWIPYWLMLIEVAWDHPELDVGPLVFPGYMALRMFPLTRFGLGLEGGARAQLKRSWTAANAALWSKCWHLAHFSLSVCKSAVRSYSPTVFCWATCCLVHLTIVESFKY